MESYHIRGGNPIKGEYTVKGAKNAVLPILAASIATGEENIFFKCPGISDVRNMREILIALGCRAQADGERILVDTAGLDCCEVPRALMEKMRSSIFLIGPLLTRCGRAVISQPGGCAIGKRPIQSLKTDGRGNRRKRSAARCYRRQSVWDKYSPGFSQCGSYGEYHAGRSFGKGRNRNP